MFNIGSGEIALIAVVALLILGPSRLPELARGIGKFMREFRRQTDEVRGVVEREFYKMDQDIEQPPPLQVHAATDVVPMNPHPTSADEEALAAPVEEVRSQLTGGMPVATGVEAPPGQTSPEPTASATEPASPGPDAPTQKS